ncbi:gephyrin-like molybdotransferase Glp [Cytobacillus sp. IB215316]|uniref:molybdopterin molybdotransferase MoeA n=1 Tax=Cytobacillus sp. IB215316 TaxID=3097354 RepID=UPI002A0F8404|nr:gephyrin-like molybdotransferase Glp [Cytobacillus sp. IB215316]MDX8361378.1 molybdopterin molybdotransferase MoeA [Cytobacillus sp. IB215316]
MVEKRQLTPVSEAVSKVMAHAKHGEIEEVSIDDCYGRFLAETIVADHDVPHFDRSAFDGFAIRAVDSIHANQHNLIEFEVVEEIGAGQVASETLTEGQAIRIMTGARMPSTADAIVMLELTKQYERDGKKYMSIKRPFKEGDNVSFKGEDTKKGTVLVEKGHVINPGIKALLATFGYSTVKVGKKPKVGVFATGSELLDVDMPLEPGKIRNSNSYMICDQIERCGGEAVYLGKLMDDFQSCYEAMKNALQHVDILITTGGVSVGDFDYIQEIYNKLGAELLFNKISMRPGSVTSVAQLNGQLLFGLSGNPSACYVGFELYARPIIRSLLFSARPHLQKIQATLNEDFPKANPFTRFVRSKLSYHEGKVFVAPSGLDKSNVVVSLASTNALMMLPGGTRGFQKGMLVDVLLLEDQEGCQWPW